MADKRKYRVSVYRKGWSEDQETDPDTLELADKPIFREYIWAGDKKTAWSLMKRRLRKRKDMEKLYYIDSDYPVMIMDVTKYDGKNNQGKQNHENRELLEELETEEKKNQGSLDAPICPECGELAEYDFCPHCGWHKSSSNNGWYKRV